MPGETLVSLRHSHLSGNRKRQEKHPLLDFIRVWRTVTPDFYLHISFDSIYKMIYIIYKIQRQEKFNGTQTEKSDII